MKELATYLPQPQGKRILIKRTQSTKDIVDLLLEADYKNKVYAPVLKEYFQQTSNPVTNLRMAYDYTISKLKYLKEGEHQTAKSIPAILKYGYGDCKHFSLTIASICRALNIPYRFRLASYNRKDKTPTHIYVVADIYGKHLTLDGTIKSFGTEKPFAFAFDYKPIK